MQFAPHYPICVGKVPSLGLCHVAFCILQTSEVYVSLPRVPTHNSGSPRMAQWSGTEPPFLCSILTINCEQSKPLITSRANQLMNFIRGWYFRYIRVYISIFSRVLVQHSSTTCSAGTMQGPPTFSHDVMKTWCNSRN